MDIHKKIDKVQDKEDFLEFLTTLANDNQNNAQEWGNKSIYDYLMSIESWIDDMEGYYDNNKINVPQNIDWKFIATIFYVGKIYE